MSDYDGIGMQALEQSAEELENTLGSASAVTTEFNNNVAQMNGTLAEASRDVRTLSGSIRSGLKSAIDGLVFDGDKLSDALRTIAKSMVDSAYSIALGPVTEGAGDLLANGLSKIFPSFFQFANGGSFAQGRVTPFASGGVVGGPTMFPMRGGFGLMGEAGPEVIMPLTRGSDGQLGVRAEGSGRAVNVVMNISTPDVEGFHRSNSQIAAQMGRVLSRGQRNR
ncbi:phage tail tape measure protein [Pseudohalocynthiibacter sp. F2068]|uniref:phage tail tape measure protein n=1 Tax=Pseudohalocynthiibacter sp. F2068 TaxID=2926418 RepID=UPI001FF688F3|nr:phage tail tape measure protein [Pseudohalocynthiibacter sp. F2068]MCK0101655.1 phage tail tape measure protein [Pseudohalocynthiibacter sp. F2068]